VAHLDAAPVAGRLVYAVRVYAIRREKAAKNAWRWRVQFIRRGELHSAHFYDLKYGGSKKALAAAIAWRNQKLQKLTPMTKREFHEQKRSNNTSGVPGVHFLRSKAQPRGSWQARVAFLDGRKTHRTFSIAKYGRRDAFALAVAARKRLLELVDDKPYLKHRTAKRMTTGQ
jgi:hypothetical protein